MGDAVFVFACVAASPRGVETVEAVLPTREEAEAYIGRRSKNARMSEAEWTWEIFEAEWLGDSLAREWRPCCECKHYRSSWHCAGRRNLVTGNIETADPHCVDVLRVRDLNEICNFFEEADPDAAEPAVPPA